MTYKYLRNVFVVLGVRSECQVTSVLFIPSAYFGTLGYWTTECSRRRTAHQTWTWQCFQSVAPPPHLTRHHLHAIVGYGLLSAWTTSIKKHTQASKLKTKPKAN